MFHDVGAGGENASHRTDLAMTGRLGTVPLPARPVGLGCRRGLCARLDGYVASAVRTAELPGARQGGECPTCRMGRAVGPRGRRGGGAANRRGRLARMLPIASLPDAAPTAGRAGRGSVNDPLPGRRCWSLRSTMSSHRSTTRSCDGRCCPRSTNRHSWHRWSGTRPNWPVRRRAISRKVSRRREPRRPRCLCPDRATTPWLRGLVRESRLRGRERS